MDHRKKAFMISGDQIKPLIPYPNEGGCFASDRIMVDGAKIGYMYREQPDNHFDSGWRFFAGDESQEYSDAPDNFGIYKLNTVCNFDPTIIPFLDAPYGSAFGRAQGANNFVSEELEPSDD
jgi:hypothetical protein